MVGRIVRARAVLEDLADNVEDAIKGAVRCRTLMAPTSLGSILDDISYRVRIIPDREVLDAALRNLLADGSIRRLPDGGYVDGRSSAGSATWQPMSDATYRSAIDVQWPGSAATQDEGVPGVPVLLASIPTATDDPTRAEWQHTERVAIAVTEALRRQRRAAVVPLIVAVPGHLEFTVFGGVNDDPHKVHRLASAFFDAAAPAGSELRPKIMGLP